MPTDTNRRFDIYHFTTSLPLSGKGDRLRWMSSLGRKVTFAQKNGASRTSPPTILSSNSAFCTLHSALLYSLTQKRRI